MGYMRHHAIIVTASDKNIEPIHIKAKEIFGDATSNILPAAVNGYRSFFIGPDGSKEYWQMSDEGNSRREDFKRWLNDPRQANAYYPRWAEIQYGDENGEQIVLAHD